MDGNLLGTWTGWPPTRAREPEMLLINSHPSWGMPSDLRPPNWRPNSDLIWPTAWSTVQPTGQGKLVPFTEISLVAMTENNSCERGLLITIITTSLMKQQVRSSGVASSCTSFLTISRHDHRFRRLTLLRCQQPEECFAHHIDAHYNPLRIGPKVFYITLPLQHQHN